MSCYFPHVKDLSSHYEKLVAAFNVWFDSEETMKHDKLQLYARVEKSSSDHNSQSKDDEYESEHTLSDADYLSSAKSSKMKLKLYQGEGSTMERSRAHYDLSIGIHMFQKSR